MSSFFEHLVRIQPPSTSVKPVRVARKAASSTTAPYADGTVWPVLRPPETRETREWA